MKKTETLNSKPNAEKKVSQNKKSTYDFEQDIVLIDGEEVPCLLTQLFLEIEKKILVDKDIYLVKDLATPEVDELYVKFCNAKKGNRIKTFNLRCI